MNDLGPATMGIMGLILVITALSGLEAHWSIVQASAGTALILLVDVVRK